MMTTMKTLSTDFLLFSERGDTLVAVAGSAAP